jgi:hypothetical protein
MSESLPKEEISEETPTNHRTKKHFLKPLLLIFSVLLISMLLLSAYFFASTPQAIKNPKLEHLHFRIQIIANGQSVNFGEQKFQQAYSKDLCTADLPAQPIHFHDNKDQFNHIHWQNITGGMVLKYYGWNFIGGPDNSMGYRFDEFPKLQNVPIHGDNLPDVPDGTNYFVYIGDENGFKEKSFEDFKKQTLEQFFEKDSNFPDPDKAVTILDKLFPKAYAHTGGEPGHSEGSTLGVEELKRINNLIGNVVIFAQQNKPSDEEVKAKFNNLVPLSDSSCGG